MGLLDKVRVLIEALVRQPPPRRRERREEAAQPEQPAAAPTAGLDISQAGDASPQGERVADLISRQRGGTRTS